MSIHFGKGSARLAAALLGGAGLLGLLIAIAMMANMAADQAETSLQTQHKAEEDIERIQEQIDIQGQRAEEIMNDMDRQRSREQDTTNATNEEDNEQ